MRLSILSLALLVSRGKSGGVQLEDINRKLLANFPDIESAIAPEISQWSTSTVEASSFFCSIWSGKTPAAIEAALSPLTTATSNPALSLEWEALATDVNLMSKGSGNPAIGSACSGLFKAATSTKASPGHTHTKTVAPITVTATVTVTKLSPHLSLSKSGLSTASSSLPSSTKSSTFCAADRCCSYYQVVSGNTCDGIAAAKNISTANIERWNPHMCGKNLEIGAKLCVKGPAHGQAPPFGAVLSSKVAASGSGLSGTRTTPFPTSASCPPKTCCGYYKVKPNDTCDEIASSKGISLDQIEQWNPNMCGSNLNIGAELCVLGPGKGAAPSFGSTPSTTASFLGSTSSSFIPIPTTPCAVGQCCQYYKVAPGDSCVSIASKEDMDEGSISTWNPGVCGSGLQIGVHLCIDGPPLGPAPPFGTCSSSSCCKFSTVAKGDTCATIAGQKEIPETFLLAWNPPDMCGNLQIGSQICTEGSAAEVGYVALTATSAFPVFSSPSTSAVLSHTLASTSTSASVSVSASATNSPGQRVVSKWGVEGLFAFVMSIGLFL